MEAISYGSRPTLRRPVLIGAFQGWNDAGEAATNAIGFLRKAWKAKEFARIDPEEFYDFQVSRPQVRLDEKGVRSIRWPEVTFFHAAIPGTDRDAILMTGIEPSFRWRTFCEAVLGVVEDTGAELAVTLGALLANRPHTRPVRVTGVSQDEELAGSLGLSPSRYEGPTGIVGVLHTACHDATVPSVSLWAWVPHYLRENPSPPATLALVERLTSLLDSEADTGDLEEASSDYHRQISEVMSADPEFAGQVEEMERQSDEEDLQDLPSGDQIAAELERFLKDQRPDG